MNRFNEVVISLALKLNYIRHEDQEFLERQFQKVVHEDSKISFDRFLQSKGFVTVQEARRLRYSVTSMIAPEIPGYKMIEFLGGGGMGEVYRAKQESLDRMVAIKILAETHRQNPDYLARFKREARAAAKVKHKNIVKIYDVNLGKKNSKTPPYFVMEFIHGKTLHEIIQSRKQLGFKQVLGISIALADAIEAISRANLVHRDIKPDNIMLTPNGEVKLCDLGLAKEQITAQQITQPGITHGTPHYMSPEQAQGRDKLDARSDMYSLGCTIYKLLAGSPPYVDDSAIEILMKHISAPIPRIREIRPDVPEDLEQVITILLQKNPAKRYLSAMNLKNDLIAIYKGETPKFDTKEAETETQFTLDLSEDPEYLSNQQLFVKEIDHDDDFSPAEIVEIDPISKGKRRITLLLLVLVLILGFLNYYVFFMKEKPVKPEITNVDGENGGADEDENTPKTVKFTPKDLRDISDELLKKKNERAKKSEESFETSLNKIIENSKD